MTDKEYRKPGGGYPSVRERRAVKGELRVNETTDTEAGYYIDMYHTKYTEEIISRMGEKIFGGLIMTAGLSLLILTDTEKTVLMKNTWKLLIRFAEKRF